LQETGQDRDTGQGMEQHSGVKGSARLSPPVVFAMYANLSHNHLGLFPQAYPGDFR
jgi:hypothetical protein